MISKPILKKDKEAPFPSELIPVPAPRLEDLRPYEMGPLAHMKLSEGEKLWTQYPEWWELTKEQQENGQTYASFN